MLHNKIFAYCLKFWFVAFCLVLLVPLPGRAAFPVTGNISLTSAEKAWLRSHQELVIAPSPDFPPIEFFDHNNRYSGISADYLRILERKLGVKFRIKHFGSWQKIEEQTKKGAVDIWGAASETAERSAFMRFTKPYISFPALIIVRKNTHRNLTLSRLKGLKVVSLARHVTDQYLSEHYPSLNKVLAPDVQTGLKMVSFGDADAIVVNAAAASYYIGELGLTNLSIAGQSDVVWPLCFASRRDWPILASILQKGLNSITAEERETINTTWVNLKLEGYVSHRSFILALLTGGGILTVVIALSLLLNRSLRRMVRQRTSELQIELDERKRVEGELLKSEERLTRFFEAAFEGIFFHTQGTIVDANPAGTDIFGYLPGEVMGKQFMVFIAPESRTLVMEKMREGDTGEYEVMGIRKDGALLPLEVRARSVGKGETLMRVVGFRDISERKQAEEALRLLNADLERRVMERTAELANAKERAESADHLKSAFLATMSHELRTPLNSIIGFTGVILQGMAGPLNDEQKKQMEMVKSSASHLLALINDVLDLSKIEAGQLTLSHHDFDLRVSLEKVVKTVRPLVNAKGLFLAVDIAPEIAMIRSDQRRVEQVLLNLLGNAIKFTEKGRITVTATISEEVVRMSVSDTGIGIKHEDLANLFKPFRQLEAGLTRRFEGTGLGLSICKKLIEQLGGEIRGESVAGEGSTFFFTLPASGRVA